MTLEQWKNKCGKHWYIQLEDSSEQHGWRVELSSLKSAVVAYEQGFQLVFRLPNGNLDFKRMEVCTLEEINKDLWETHPTNVYASVEEYVGLEKTIEAALTHWEKLYEGQRST